MIGHQSDALDSCTLWERLAGGGAAAHMSANARCKRLALIVEKPPVHPEVVVVGLGPADVDSRLVRSGSIGQIAHVATGRLL